MHRLFTAARSAGTYAHGVRCLLVMLAVVRACIPAGFMPDPAALAQGRWALMLCPSAVDRPIRSVALGDHREAMRATEHADHDNHADHANHMAGHDVGQHAGADAQPAGLDCPYSMVTNLAGDLPSPVRVIALLPREAPDVAARAPQSRPPLPSAGPPLGSRAPPRLQA